MTLSGTSRPNGTLELPPIPWSFTDSEGGVWLWTTEVFRAVISTVGPNGYYWEVSHVYADANPEVVSSGSLGSFADAEFAVRETVGKAYRIEAGFRPFAGKLATTFQLANGRWLDFGPLEHARARITVRRTDGGSDVYSGLLRVNHFMIDLGTENGGMSIVPSHILDVRRDNGITPETMDSAKRPTRITDGNVTPGCTGRHGFTPGTVDHFDAPQCPVHETGRH